MTGRERSTMKAYVDTDSDTVTDTLADFDSRSSMDQRFLLNTVITLRGGFFSSSLEGLNIQFGGYNLLDSDTRDPDLSTKVANDLPKEGRNFLGKVSYKF